MTTTTTTTKKKEYSKTTKDTTVNINLVRIEVKDNSFTSIELTKKFKDAKVSYSKHLVPFLIKRNVLIRTEEGKYQFVNHDKPVNVKLIDDFVTYAYETQKSYTDKYKSKEKEITITTLDGFNIKGVEHTNYRVVTVSGQFAIIDENNNIIRVF